MKKIVKWSALLLCLCLLLPTAAFAAPQETVTTKEEFIAAAEDASVTQISVGADMDLTGANVLNVSGKTIDLGGHTISATNFTLIFEGENFVIQNGTMDAKGGDYALFVGDVGSTDNVLVKNVTFHGGVNVYNATNVVLEDVSVSGVTYYAVWCDANGHVTIKSGSFSSQGNAVLGISATEGEMRIEGGDFTVKDGQPLVLEGATPEAYHDPVIVGGTFNTDVEDYRSPDAEAVPLPGGGYIVCRHTSTEIRNASEATQSQTGYTGDTHCAVCGKLLQKGEVIAMLVPKTADRAPLFIVGAALAIACTGVFCVKKARGVK